jgi:PHD/YefM family antitoxin component YafN of YafNO toxin-antitoxin module
MKSKEQANTEMQTMFESLKEAIVLVDKEKIAFQNSEFESMMEHLRQLSSEVNMKKGESLDQKIFYVKEDSLSSSIRDQSDNGERSFEKKFLSINDILAWEKKKKGFAENKVFCT